MSWDYRLRPFTQADVETMLTRFAAEPEYSAPFQWHGFRAPEEYRHRFERDGFLDEDPRLLVVTDVGDAPLGWVAWREAPAYGRSAAFEIGIVIAPEHRGRGVGTHAQRALADYLFDTRPVHKIIAFTENGNAAEQRALENAGFVREGVLRQHAWRGGQWRDAVAYGLLREEWRATTA